MDLESNEPAEKEVASNKDYVSDMQYTMKYTRRLLTILGVWPAVSTNPPTRFERCASVLLLPFCSVILIVLVICSVCHVVVRDVDRSELIALLAPIGFTVTSIVKHFILISRCDLINLCVRHMTTDWGRIENENDREVMTRNLRVGHNLTIVCAVFMYSGALFSHAIKPLCSLNAINEFNESARPLFFPGADIFVDLHAGFNYEIVFCSICITGFVNFTIYIAICNLAAIFVTHACGQIQIVVSKLESLVDPDDDGGGTTDNDLSLTTVVNNRISCIIRLHVRALRFSSKIDEILRQVCLLEVVTSTLIICLVEYYCMTEWNNSDPMAIVMHLLVLVSLVFNILIFCHIGELLKDKSTQVGRTASAMEWYKLPGKSALSLVLIMAMSKYPRRLTAGRMMELSIVTFGSIMKTSLAYLNMLRTVTDS